MQYGKSQEAIDRLTAEQRRVTQEAGTERPFNTTIARSVCDQWLAVSKISSSNAESNRGRISL